MMIPAAMLLGQKRVPSMFANLVRDRYGRVKHVGAHHPNLRTNDGLDWQAGILGDYTFNGTTGGPTGVSASTMTDTGASWTTDQWKGHVVLYGSGDANAPFIGVVKSNTGTVLTVGLWNTAANYPSVTTTVTPSGTGARYLILPGRSPLLYMATTEDATAPAVTDTALTGELNVGAAVFGRALPTSYSHTAATNSFSIAKTFTCGATGRTINKEAVFIGPSGGVMPFESAEPSPPTLVSGDTLAQTVTITF